MHPVSNIILQIMADLSSYYKKAYIFPSQQTLLRLLHDRSNITISRRTLNRRLTELQENGYFQRIKRHTAGLQGQILLRSTLYILKAKFYTWVNTIIGKAKKWIRYFRVPTVAQYKLLTGYIKHTSAPHTPPCEVSKDTDKWKKRPSFNEKDFQAILKRLETKIMEAQP